MASVGNSSDIELNIMPMLDIFSILILFLLINFSTDPVNHTVTKGVELASSLTMSSLDEVPAVTMSKTQVLINDRPIAAIIGDDVEASALKQGAIGPAFDEFKKMAEISKRIKTKTNKVNSLTIEVDKDHSFKLVKRLLLAAQQAEFTSFKLMVIKTNS